MGQVQRDMFDLEAARAGDVERATQKVRHLEERIGSSRRYRIPYLRARFVLAEHHGAIDLALAYLQEATQLAEDIGLRDEVWSIQATLGIVYRQQDNEVMASDASAHACEDLSSLSCKIADEQQRTIFLSAEPARWTLERASFLP